MIRGAREEDLEGVLEIAKDAFPYIKDPRAFFSGRISAGGFFVYEEGGHILGFVDVSVAGERGFVEGIAVRRGFRGRGIGKKLLSYALDFLRKKGAKRVYLRTLRTNREALSLYRSMGFRVVEEGPVLVLTRLL